ncbi:HNH endonuclease signature motif containing protein [Naasia aerilata]|uniref:HNH endonuclease n=1 Tax=Naasia aerilata TaxID=1162966 RepID=A0ABM8GBJ6_9MICO|nr:HNH endonuclease signature motif containing protein [Naasia aerilata]BDZ45609.1 HNH endonuclease [Naasia aerilata]
MSLLTPSTGAPDGGSEGAERLTALRYAVDDLQLNERDANFFTAQRYVIVDEVRQAFENAYGASLTTDPAGLQARAMRAEVAGALCIPEVTAEALVVRARTLVHELPTTLEKFRDGAFGERHARILADATAGLSPAEIAELERRALPYAETLTAAKFDRKVKVLVQLIHPDELTERHRNAYAEREVRREPARDGMAWIGAYLAAPIASGIDDFLDKAARSLKTKDETRTHAQLRADVFRDVLLDDGAILPAEDGHTHARIPNARPRGIVPTVHVTVPALNLVPFTAGGAAEPDFESAADQLAALPALKLAGRYGEPAMLAGYGPIDPETAAQLVGQSKGLHRILTDPDTGVTVQFGRTRYRIPEELARYLRQRDGTCRFVGCNRPAERCDLDHTKPWEEGGCTDACNLACLCKGHHRLKHGTDWTIRQDPNESGELICISPAGKIYRTEPANKVTAGPPGRPLGRAVAQTEWAPAESDIAPF